MSDETPGVGQSAPPPQGSLSAPRLVADRSAVRLTHVAGGQYVITQPGAIPALAQLSPGTNPQGVTRIISISPSRGAHNSQLRPSLQSQNIVNVLTKSRATPGNPNIRLQLFQNAEMSRPPIKRPLPTTPEKRDTYAVKLQRVMNHKIVRSKLVKEKYNEHLLERYFLEAGGNILDLYQFAKRQKTPTYLAYLKEHSINPREDETGVQVPQTVASTPSATPVSALPGISPHHSSSSSVVRDQTPVEQRKVRTPTTGGQTPVNSQEQIVEKAKQEAYVVQRIADLQKEGLWSEKRLPRVQEMPRAKAHWDFLLEEMVWLAADFAQERKWKKAAAKKCARMVQKYFQDKASAAQRAEKAHEQHLRRIAAFCAKEIKNFWNNVEKLVEYKQHTILEVKRKRALDQQLSFIVDQTEKYSQLLAEGMNKTTECNVSSGSVSRVNSDDEFHPDNQNSEDDEETIEQEEKGLDSARQSEEVAALQRESEMDLDDFLKELPKDYLQNRDKIRLSDEEDSDVDDDKPPSKDEDFAANSNSEDDEATIQEQEKAEGSQNHQEEIDDLNAENELSIDELRKKYLNLPPIPDEGDESSNSSLESAEPKVLSDSEEESEDEASSEEEDLSETEDVAPKGGLQSLLDDSHIEGEDTKTDQEDDLINDAAALAESLQPTGNTLSSTSVSTKVPFLIKFTLREYQHVGLEWLVTMFDRKLNGILADEMGLGKTIQTIALLAHLACEKENWGPHLIVVPTSVMLNWEMECKKWCPAFKILTYYGSQKERKLKRTGWTKANAFHICITSYKLVIQDHQAFRRKKWKYLILDEAQNIKNFKSQRWQLLLNFQTQQRLLLTGTPLQNNLMELWSLMHFLMPNVFQSHREFKEWFSNPVTGMIEGNSEYNENIIKRLHKVLRPFLLRRLKCEVEKQMPKKYEHVVMCRLSKRQRYLYDDYMSRAKTRETLESGNLLSVINVLMQLRKVCNHPNLFEVRPTVSSFQCDKIVLHVPSSVYEALRYDVWKHVSLWSMNLDLIRLEMYISAYQCYRTATLQTPRAVIEGNLVGENIPPCPPSRLGIKLKKAELKTQDSIPKNHQQKVKFQVGSQINMQLIPQHGVVKTIPINICQSPSQGNLGSPNASLLKSENKLSAQLVQTSTGKHLLLTPTSNVSNLPVSATTAGGPKLTFLSKAPVSTPAGGNSHQITKAFVKFQLTSVTANTTNTISTITTTASQSPIINSDPIVGHKFLDKLYSNQNHSLDVRWKSNKEDKKDDEDNAIPMSIRLNIMANINVARCQAKPIYGSDLQNDLKIFVPPKSNIWAAGRSNCLNVLHRENLVEPTKCLEEMLKRPEERIEEMAEIFNKFVFYVPSVRASQPDLRVFHPDSSIYWGQKRDQTTLTSLFSYPSTPLHPLASAMVTQFPDPRLIQYDCGKLQTLDKLLRKLKTGGHRVLIFTQMTKMLDVLEAFLNFHGHIYLRLDGSTKIDQRQVLMERFNGDTRIFAFILSTRSGGVGVNLTGADTVVFYDSDWNPTMDAQAQDRCHRIGQTRDVHIYRLVSERTIEENILKKANQKRLLGDLAIEGGNFTTAYFKGSTIQDLFNIDANEESAANRMSEVVQSNKERATLRSERVQPSQPSTSGQISPVQDEKAAMGALESALAQFEDAQDVVAARTAKAEAVADLAEFDENIPLEDTVVEKEPEMTKAEQEIHNVIEQLTPIEKYAMKFIEDTELSAEVLAAAERQIEEQKREWEANRLAAMKEEEERRARELEEENDILTFDREDATNQIWVSENTNEQMPMWCPPTPPQQDADVYIDNTMAFLYDTQIMSESQLPPVYIKREAKRNRLEAGITDSRRPLKIARKESPSTAPRSLFHPHPLVKVRRDSKFHRVRGLVRPLDPLRPGSITGQSGSAKPPIEQTLFHQWTIHEDMALLKVIQSFQGLPLNLLVLSPAHVPNWDFVADYVNTISVTYRSPKQCRQRYETALMQREEGKPTFDSTMRKKKTKSPSSANATPQNKFGLTSQQKSNRTMRTSQLYTQDNNSSFSQTMIQCYESMKSMSTKRTPTTRTGVNNPLLKNPKHTALLNECGIDLDHPVLPQEVAARRAERERIAREKKMSADQQQRLLLKASLGQAGNAAAQAAASTSSQPTPPPPQIGGVSQVTPVQTATAQIVQAVASHSQSIVVTSASISAPNTPPNTVRTPTGQRLIASPLQSNATVVSVSGLSPAQLQAATTQRLLVSAPGKGVGTATAGKSITPAQLQVIKQAAHLKHHLRLQAQAGKGGTHQATVTIGGQPAVVQFSQAQNRAQFVRQGAVTVAGKTARAVTEVEVAQILKKQQQLQQKAAAAAQQGQSSPLQTLGPQVYATQAIAQAGTSGGQVATLVKTVSNTGASQTVTIPVTGMNIVTQGGKAQLASTIKTNQQQLRQIQMQQQLLAQKKLAGQKINIAQVGGKSNMQTQLIVGSKPLNSTMTVQQFQQVIRAPLNVSPGPVVLAKGTSRVIPVNTGPGGKQTIQVVAASQALTSALRPQQGGSTLAGALAGIRMQGGQSTQAQQALLSHVSAALQSQNVRQGSPVRIQTASGAPIVAVTVQSPQQPQSGAQQTEQQQIGRILKKN